jgi:hypothetical protein
MKIDIQLPVRLGLVAAVGEAIGAHFPQATFVALNAPVAEIIIPDDTIMIDLDNEEDLLGMLIDAINDMGVAFTVSDVRAAARSAAIILCGAHRAPEVES